MLHFFLISPTFPTSTSILPIFTMDLANSEKKALLICSRLAIFAEALLVRSAASDWNRPLFSVRVLK